MSHTTPYLQKILAAITANPNFTVDDLAAHFNISSDAVYSNLARLRNAGHSYRINRKRRFKKNDRHESVIKVLEATPGACAKTVGNKLGLSATTVNRTVRELRNMGFTITNGYAIARRATNDNSIGNSAS